MDLGLKGRNALVCASTSGLGEATARALAAEGANVVVSGRRAERARRIAAELPGAVAVEADLLAEDGADLLHAAAVEAVGPIDVLVLNGPGPKPGGAAEMSSADVRQAVESLVVPQQRLVSLVLPGMRTRGWGRILSIASSGVVAPLAHLALSNLGRAALAGYLKTLAGEVAGDGVTVNLLLPGRIATDRLAQLDEATASRTGASREEIEEQGRASIPARRYGRPEEFGAVAAFLCGEPASYVTGTALRCDGGDLRSL
ncbi:SDR family oxidoreductase [Spongiactinospora sp. TRM90649]|uniref:SDR family oxidoreductase n=1 Tax=Spongiactinospora sp. TRM90649 TaxID=3031114 RepID=UPI0023F6C1B6|nr:SDR family oxidoreductase [Spongiactinospora sp. TRM90649]MDF5757057.1 SDR family oxidoreductase [Spongiactinospora sp. TRM90649]